jgi:hypothetical protein
MNEKSNDVSARISRAHWPNWTFSLVGLGCIAIGLVFPEKSEALIGGVISIFLGLVNASRQGVQKTVGSTNEQLDTTLRVALGAVGEAITGLRLDLDRKHIENQQEHERMLATLAADRTANDEYHKANDTKHVAHETKIAVLTSRVESLDTDQRDLAREVRRVADNMERLTSAS